MARMYCEECDKTLEEECGWPTPQAGLCKDCGVALGLVPLFRAFAVWLDCCPEGVDPDMVCINIDRRGCGWITGYGPVPHFEFEDIYEAIEQLEMATAALRKAGYDANRRA